MSQWAASGKLQWTSEEEVCVWRHAALQTDKNVLFHGRVEILSMEWLVLTTYKPDAVWMNAERLHCLIFR